MGWFSSVCSAIGGAVKSVASAAGRAISSGLSWAREKASKAMDWIAEKGEKFIDGVKEVYKKVKPFLEKASPWIAKLAKTATAMGFPWIGTGLTIVAKVVDHLVALDKSPIANKLEKALRGVIKFAQFVKQRYLTSEEMEEAKEYKESFAEAQNVNLNQEQMKALQLAQMLNSYGLVKTELRDVLEFGVGDFQHYLRLRATQKLLDEADHKLSTTKDVDEVSEDDIFLINIAEQLLSTTDLSEDESIKLDQIVNKRFGKSLIPFVFEELMMVWVDKQLSLENEWKTCSAEFAKDRVLKTRLEVAKKTSSLTEEENEVYEALLPRMVGLESKLKRLEKENRSMKNYVYAAEGFMQILEKDDELLQAEDKDYLINDSAEIASIIMRVAQNNIDWDTLTPDEQSLITDYANIFAKEGKARANKLHEALEVGVVA